MITNLKATCICILLANINLRLMNTCYEELNIINGKTTNTIETVYKLNITNIKSSYLKLLVGTSYTQVCK